MKIKDFYAYLQNLFLKIVKELKYTKKNKSVIMYMHALKKKKDYDLEKPFKCFKKKTKKKNMCGHLLA